MEAGNNLREDVGIFFDLPSVRFYDDSDFLN